MTKTQVNTIVLFGGEASEHRVSVASAQYLSKSLPLAQYWFWSRDGAIHEISVDELGSHSRPFEIDFVPSAITSWKNIDAAVRNAAGSVLFLALHGGAGEDGTIQALLQRQGIEFTGSDSSASRLSFDKQRCKDAVVAAGVSVPKGSVVRAGGDWERRVTELLSQLGPLVVKPLADGSSTGLRFLRSRNQIVDLCREAERNREYLIEETITGTELTVGVVELADRSIRALPCSEIAVSDGHSFDFDGKYLGKGTTEFTPARISETNSRAAQEMAMLAHRVLGCYGYSRTDMILRGDEVVFLETNTLPGLTEASFIPQELKAAGISMDTFVNDQIYLAKHRSDLESRPKPHE